MSVDAQASRYTEYFPGHVVLGCRCPVMSRRSEHEGFVEPMRELLFRVRSRLDVTDFAVAPRAAHLRIDQ
jgi:hypothetical protein